MSFPKRRITPRSPPLLPMRGQAHFSKVPIINGPSKMSPIYIKDRGFNSFASNMIKLSVNETKWSSLLARTGALILYISIWIFDFGPVKLPGLSRNWPLISGYLNTWFGTRKVTGTFEKRTQGPSGQSKMAAKLTKEEAEEYFTRINYTGSKEPTVEVLTELHRCHILYVPFENLSVYGKEKIELSKEWLFEKIARRHRGGFCFELNKMFSFLLNYLGFEYTTLAASVFRRKTGVQSPPLSHLVLMVKARGGGYSHTLPIRVCAAQRGRNFEAPDLERGIHFRCVF